MRVKLSWMDEEEGMASFYRWRNRLLCVRIHVMGETQAELSFDEEIREIDEISEKVIFEMTKFLKKIQKRLRRENLTDILLPAEAESKAAAALWELHSTGVVEYDCSEYMLKKQCNPKEYVAKEGLPLDDTECPQSKTLSILPGKNENDYFSCRVAPYLDGCYLYEISVREDMQNQGIGTAAMKELMQRAREIMQVNRCGGQTADSPAGLADNGNSPGSFYLQVSSKNPRALHLYRKLGFQTQTELCYFRLR